MTITSTTATTSSSAVVTTTAITMTISCDSSVSAVDVGCGVVGVLVEVGVVLKLLLGRGVGELFGGGVKEGETSSPVLLSEPDVWQGKCAQNLRWIHVRMALSCECTCVLTITY